MFIGHFGIAFLLFGLFPGVPIWAILLAVCFPDLMWPLLIFAGIEKAKIDKDSPLQDRMRFITFQYSHSFTMMIGTGAFVGLLLSFLLSDWNILLIFIIGSISHFILDIVMHFKDMQVLGFGRSDKKLGFGLWRHGRAAFVIEYLFYLSCLAALKPKYVLPFLIVGTAFHLANSDSFLGFTKKNLFKRNKSYAAAVFLAYSAFVFISTLII